MFEVETSSDYVMNRRALDFQSLTFHRDLSNFVIYFRPDKMSFGLFSVGSFRVV
jgi:hypothetical protein